MFPIYAIGSGGVTLAGGSLVVNRQNAGGFFDNTITMGADAAIAVSGNQVNIEAPILSTGGNHNLTKTGIGTLFLNNSPAHRSPQSSSNRATLVRMEVQTARSVIVQTGGSRVTGPGGRRCRGGHRRQPIHSKSTLCCRVANGPANAGALYYAGWYGTGPYSSTFSGPVTLNGTTGFGTGGGNVIVSGTIGGTGGLTVLGGNVLNLTGTNTFSGTTTISGGTLALGNPLALQNSTLDTSGSGALSFGLLTAATLGGLTDQGSLSLTNAASNAVALSVGNDNSNTTYAGTLNGLGNLVKTGNGQLTIAGPQSYNGTTTIQSGILQRSSAVVGFGGNGTGWTLNGSPSILPGIGVSNNLLTLTTTAQSSTNSLWYNRRLPIAGVPWTASFTYNDVYGGGADGGAFVLQTSPSGTAALGPGGTYKGVYGITPSSRSSGTFTRITAAAEWIS